MNEGFKSFINSIRNEVGISKQEEIDIDKARSVLMKINEYLYSTRDNIGATTFNEKQYAYVSDFHIFWEKHHREILDPCIDDNKCEKTADILHELYKQNAQKLFYDVYDTYSLTPEEICNVRFFVANQDFRGSRDFEKAFKAYQDDPAIFEVKNIYDDPESYLSHIEVSKLSQNDKRIKYAKESAKALHDLNIKPYDLFNYHNKDLQKIKSFMLNMKSSGYGNKKIDMFIRDMVVLDVWKESENFSTINVASDINTIKVALRAGILTTKIPLMSSFIDIFCHQYTLIDEFTAKAWRRVWEIWRDKYPENCVESPCLIDYLVYRIIGKEFCKDKLTEFTCFSNSHTFKWHSSRNKSCQKCKVEKAKISKKILPCTDSEGWRVIEKSKYVTGKDSVLPGIKTCPMSAVCQPMDPSFKKLNPPKSISILGQTGWTTAYSNQKEGGGGLMS